MIFNRKTILFLVSFTFCGLNVQSQNSIADSLENELLLHPKKDTIRVNLLSLLINQIYDLDVNKAENLIEEVESISKKTDYKKGKANAIYYKGHVETVKSNYEQAIKCFSESLQLYKSINYKKGVSYSLNGIGIAYYFQGDYTKAIEFYNKSAKIDKEQNDLKGVAGSFNNIGNIYADQGKYEKAIDYYEKAKKLKEEIGDLQGAGRSYGNIGSIYGEQSNFPKALENFNKALTIYDQTGSDAHVLLLNFAAVYQIQNKYDEALIYVNRALEINKKQNNKREIASCLNVIGDIYKEQALHKKALGLYIEALTLNKEIKSKRGIAITLNNIATMQLVLEQESEALYSYNKALVINKEIESQLGTCRSYLGLSRVYYSKKQNVKALDFALESQKISGKLELLVLQKEAYEMLSKIYSSIGQYDKALISHQQFKILNDSIFNKENIEKITQLEYEYKFQQELESANNREIKLNKSVKSTSLDLKKSQRNSFIAIIIILLVSIVSASIIFYLKLRNVNAKTQNILIEQKLLRSQMTPHFIFNSLSVLQGMILNKEDKKAVSYLSKFSKLLRIILENSRDKMVSLNQELIAVENYLALHNIEENEAYNYTLVVDGLIDISTFNIPPMLIQPFIENAIEHAFGNQKENRKIDVHLKLVENNLVCTITDNGVGIETFIENKNSRKKSLATTITSERLKILSKDFKKEGSMKIEDRATFKEQGTIVTLVIPYKVDVVE